MRVSSRLARLYPVEKRPAVAIQSTFFSLQLGRQQYTDPPVQRVVEMEVDIDGKRKGRELLTEEGTSRGRMGNSVVGKKKAIK